MSRAFFDGFGDGQEIRSRWFPVDAPEVGPATTWGLLVKGEDGKGMRLVGFLCCLDQSGHPVRDAVNGSGREWAGDWVRLPSAAKMSQLWFGLVAAEVKRLAHR